ncbi:MAG: hypothetical protein COA49_00850 [Bacteroidetes bacterium]|nr:MAG: hypothetical protein COA49_00850 [Bacteroidota bacterium]
MRFLNCSSLLFIIIFLSNFSKTYSQEQDSIITFNRITPVFLIDVDEPWSMSYPESGTITSVYETMVNNLPGFTVILHSKAYTAGEPIYGVNSFRYSELGFPLYGISYIDSISLESMQPEETGANRRQRNHNDNITVPLYEYESPSSETNYSKRSILIVNDAGQVINKLIYDSVYTEHKGVDIMQNVNNDPVYYLTGEYSDSPNGSSIGSMWKTDSTGQIIWTQTYLDTQKGMAIEPDHDLGFWLSMKVNTTTNGEDIAIIKTDQFGNEESRILFGGLGNGDDVIAFQLSEEVIVIGSVSSDEIEGQRTLFTTTIQIEPSGQLIEIGPRKEYGTAERIFYSGYIIEDSGLLIFGGKINYADPPNYATNEITNGGILLKLDAERELLWLRVYRYFDDNIVGHPNNSDTEHRFFTGAKTLDGGYILGGNVLRVSPFQYFPWLVKVDSFGCLEPGCQNITGVNEYIVGLESVMTVYPNPVSNICSIDFNYPENFSVPDGSYLRLYDMSGIQVSELSGPSARDSKISMSVENLSSGNYVLAWISGSKLLDSVQITVAK